MRLEIVRDLFQYNPQLWTRLCAARDSKQRGVKPESGAAVQWCVEGACVKWEVNDEEYQCLSQAAQTFRDRLPENRGDHEKYYPSERFVYPSDVNDWFGYETTLEMLDKAIEIYKEKYGTERKTFKK